MIKYVKTEDGYNIIKNDVLVGAVEKFGKGWLIICEYTTNIHIIEKTRKEAVAKMFEHIELFKEYRQAEQETEAVQETPKFHKSEYTYKHEDKTMNDINGLVARKLFDRFQKDSSLMYRCICRDNGRIIMGFRDKTCYDAITELIAQEGIEKDYWFKWDAPLKFKVEGTTIYIQEYLTETLFDIRESEYYESMSDAYHGVEEDEGRYSIYDVYKDSELL